MLYIDEEFVLEFNLLGRAIYFCLNRQINLTNLRGLQEFYTGKSRRLVYG